MKKPYIIGGGIAILIIIAGGLYFFLSGNHLSDLFAQKTKLEGNVVVAQGNLSRQKEKLLSLTTDLRSSYPLAISVQDQIKNSTDIVGQTDFMFTDANGSNPELIVKNYKNSLAINAERKKINLLLSLWHKKTDILSLVNLNAKESAQIRLDAEMIKAFIQNLTQTVANFTPANSGLSQFQIDNYLAQLPSVDSINQVLASLGTAITIDANKNLPNSGGANNTPTQNDQNNPNPAPIVPAVTPDEVIAQQRIVDEAQTQVEILQQQLNQVEEQIKQSTPPITPPEPPVIPPVVTPEIPIPPVTGNQDNSDVNNTGKNVSPITPHGTTSQGLIIQPGPPRLIQGTNSY